MGLLQSGLELIDSISKQNGSSVRNFRALSPRFMPLMPDKNVHKDGFLSPTILALYNDTNTNSIANLPDVCYDLVF